MRSEYIVFFITEIEDMKFCYEHPCKSLDDARHFEKTIVKDEKVISAMIGRKAKKFVLSGSKYFFTTPNNNIYEIIV